MAEEPRLPPLPATTLPLPATARGMDARMALRLHLLRIAADISPRLTGGVRADEVVERARVLELYVAGSPPGSEAQAPSGLADPGTGAPETAPDAGPADLRHDGAEIGGERQQPSA